jgi:biopolymer transport protein ExbB/TolQ|tara:strand:- start:443 stop:964 length:522 start_codon:yes stop_codon:yes gene_type:complete
MVVKMIIEQLISDFLQSTGNVGYILLGISALSLVITIYKIYEFLYAGVIPTPFTKNKWKKAFEKASNQQEIEQIGMQYTDSLQNGFLILSLIITIAPLLGLLGTVIGMIDAFQVMASLGDAVNVASLASGIWKALMTTASGLSVAISALLILNVLQFLLDKHINKLNYILKKW